MNVSDRFARYVSRGLAAVGLLGAAHYYVLGGEFTLRDMVRIEAALDAQSAEVAHLAARRDSLRARADSLEHEPSAIERVARERYGFIRPGEILVRFVEDPAPSDESGSTSGPAGTGETEPREGPRG